MRWLTKLERIMVEFVLGIVGCGVYLGFILLVANKSEMDVY